MRPTLEVLEDRCPLATFKVDFSGAVGDSGKMILNSDFNVLFTAADASTYQRSFATASDELATTVRDRIVNAMTAAGWNVTTDGDTAFQIKGHGLIMNSTCLHANAYMPGYKEEFQPKITEVKEPAVIDDALAVFLADKEKDPYAI